MIPRLGPVLAIARRDVVQELRGRRGFTLGLITLGLLMPGATFEPPRPAAVDAPVVRVSGDVPEAVRALPDVEVVPRGGALVFRRDHGRLEVEGARVPPSVRRALDGDAPAIEVRGVSRPISLPRRSMLLALLASAVLSGALSESLGGERSRRTLQALLTAAVTRVEIVTGKWLAWGGYGAVAATFGAAVAMATGRQEAGWWLVPLPTVPLVTAALGLFLVRRAADVLTGATASVRWLPLVLAGSGLLAWWLGTFSPLLGASVPLGGALVAAGATWPGAAPALVGAGSAMLTALGLVTWTARDLDRPPSEAAPLHAAMRSVVTVSAVAAFAWWPVVAGTVLWAPAGNPMLVEQLPSEAGPIAGGLGLVLAATVVASRAIRPAVDLGLWWPRRAREAGLAVVAAAGLVLSRGAEGWSAAPSDATLALARTRMADALEPASVAALLFVVVGQELLFRGALQRVAGPVASTLAFAAVFSPLDPARGLLLGGVLAALAHACGGAVLPGIAARLVAAVVLVHVPAPAAIGAVAAIGMLVALGGRGPSRG